MFSPISIIIPNFEVKKILVMKKEQSFMKNLILWENLVARNKVPLINAIFYPSGDLLVIDSTYIDDKFNLKIICKSSIESFSNFNDIEAVSNFDVLYELEKNGYCVKCSEGSYESDGIIYVIDSMKQKLLWVIFLTNSDPFGRVEIDSENIYAHSTNGFKLIISIKSPENLIVENQI